MLKCYHSILEVIVYLNENYVVCENLSTQITKRNFSTSYDMWETVSHHLQIIFHIIIYVTFHKCQKCTIVQ